MSTKQKHIETIIDSLSLEQKVGQCLVVDFTGTVVTPHLRRLIGEYNCAGLRVQSDSRIKDIYHSGALSDAFIEERSFRPPKGGSKDFAFSRPTPYCRASEYASVLNTVKQLGLDREHGIPLHLTLDQEGAGYENFTCGDVRLFPTQMGMAATGDPELVYRGYKVFARQLRKAGFSWIHSPVLDVNTDPRNPEIGIRSFSDDPEKVAAFGCAMVRAFNEEGLIATGKHFPGRGESAVDAHRDLPTIDLEREILSSVHLEPYRRAIESGLPAVMIAHTIYPALDAEPIPATVSRRIITDVLRGELGFKGAITSDNMLMSGMIKNYELPEACIQSLLAGATLLLPRCESPMIDEIYWALVEAAKSGRLSEDLLDEAIACNLSVKYDFGLFEDGGLVDVDEADRYQKDPEAKAVEVEVARRSVVQIRDDAKRLPVAKDCKVLLIDQTGGSQTNINSFQCHPGIFWEMMLEQSQAAMNVEVDGFAPITPEDRERVLRRVEEAELIVATNWEVHRRDKFNGDFLEELVALGKPMIVVTNSPYRIRDCFETVFVTFADNPESLRAVAEVIYGVREASGVVPVSNL